MMTYEDAIKCLNNVRKNPDYVYAGYCDCVDLEALDKAIGALEQQVQRKVHKKKDLDITFYYCPVCGEDLYKLGYVHIKWKVIIPDKTPYCYRCGQRLKWE